MISAIREQYNQQFTIEKYRNMLADISKYNAGILDFRLAETPVFIDKEIKNKLLKAGDQINSFITSTDFKRETAQSFSQVATPPNESPLPSCIVMDFAITINNQHQITPQLIELQGFPSLFGFELYHHRAIQANFEMPVGFSPFLNGFDEISYLSLLKQIIKGTENKHTVLLELYPHTQKTKIDFYITQQLLDIPIVCLSEITKKGSELFYHLDGVEIKIERIYNRIVWDELAKQSIELRDKATLLLKNIQVEWVTHPNHFYRISKYIMPYLHYDAVPDTHFLAALKSIPSDLENYVLKPLFSYAGQGVIIDVAPHHIKEIQDPGNWILQKKVVYAPVIDTPTGPAKTEIRLFYFWDITLNKYVATFNLARISKGKMIGVSYNQNTDWVGGSIAYFEENT